MLAVLTVPLTTASADGWVGVSHVRAATAAGWKVKTRSDGRSVSWRVSGRAWHRVRLVVDGRRVHVCRARPCVLRIGLASLATGKHRVAIRTLRGRAISRIRFRVVRVTISRPAAPVTPSSAAASASVNPGGTTPATVGNAPFAAGASAGNVQFGPDACGPDAACVSRERVMVRWVARHTGVISALYLQFASSPTSPLNCPTGANGYGGGSSGIAQISTYPVRADGTPETGQLLARTELTPCQAADGGSVAVPLGFATVHGQELATVVQDADPKPLENYFSLNTLYDPRGLSGANGRNERSAQAADVFYGLDPRELIARSVDAGSSWTMPLRGFVPTYVQVYADGFRDGQPYLYATCPCPGALQGTQTMTFPAVPSSWTIRELGAYTVAAGSARVDLLVDDRTVASATLSGEGMLRAPIAPVTVPAGSTVKVRTTAGPGGLAIVRIDADTTWKLGPVLTLGAGWRWQYLEQQGGGAAEQAVVTVYPLPMYPT